MPKALKVNFFFRCEFVKVKVPPLHKAFLFPLHRPLPYSSPLGMIKTGHKTHGDYIDPSLPLGQRLEHWSTLSVWPLILTYLPPGRICVDWSGLCPLLKIWEVYSSISFVYKCSVNLFLILYPATSSGATSGANRSSTEQPRQEMSIWLRMLTLVLLGIGHLSDSPQSPTNGKPEGLYSPLTLAAPLIAWA